jgi:hypothetical protein
MGDQEWTDPNSPEFQEEKLRRIRRAKNREATSEYIRIGQSDLYDWEPMRRAVLKEIAFLQVNDAKVRKPMDSAFDDYVGWCYASQKFLACRVGCLEDYVQKSTTVFEQDGVMETRSWTDSHGYPHTEYHVKEDVVTAHQRSKDYMSKPRRRPQKGGNRKANKGSFQVGNRAALSEKPPARSAVSTLPISRMPPSRSAVMPPSRTAVMPTASTAVLETAEQPSKGVYTLGGGDSLRSSVEGSNFVGDNPASHLAPAAAGAAVGEKRVGVSVTSTTSPLRPVGTITKGYPTPIPNWKRYPRLFAGRVDKYGRWLGGRVPNCPKCKNNLQPQERHGDCDYMPQYDDVDWDQKEYDRQASLDEMRAEAREAPEGMDEDEICSADDAEEYSE